MTRKYTKKYEGVNNGVMIPVEPPDVIVKHDGEGVILRGFESSMYRGLIWYHKHFLKEENWFDQAETEFWDLFGYLHQKSAAPTPENNASARMAVFN